MITIQKPLRLAYAYTYKYILRMYILCEQKCVLDTDTIEHIDGDVRVCDTHLSNIVIRPTRERETDIAFRIPLQMSKISYV